MRLFSQKNAGGKPQFGAFRPCPDKIMVAFVLVLLVQVESSIWINFKGFLVEFISSLREWMAQLGQHATVKVSQIGKWKTTAQMIAIGCLLYSEEFVGVSMQLFGFWVFCI
ncbi:MAG: hypothetical protein H0A75_06890 [Candidatus Methanofishera endochildressiae]|uniref:Uncharacterized protein n=1 Tax=Candidatus Methanofishera endochildressiae TaxID=2738884 RepID=A0A7Z0SE18_9GAMM|nr:hypothetical protein [Candidatus Methanofishera endochildressiae]